MCSTYSTGKCGVLRSAPEALRRFKHCHHILVWLPAQMIHFEEKFSDDICSMDNMQVVIKRYNLKKKVEDPTKEENLLDPLQLQVAP